MSVCNGLVFPAHNYLLQSCKLVNPQRLSGPGFPLQQIASIYKPFHTLWINHMLCTEKTNSMTCKSQRTHKALEERRSWSVFFRLHECIHNILTQRQRTELRTWTEVQIPQERPSAVVKRRCTLSCKNIFEIILESTTMQARLDRIEVGPANIKGHSTFGILQNNRLHWVQKRLNAQLEESLHYCHLELKAHAVEPCQQAQVAVTNYPCHSRIPSAMGTSKLNVWHFFHKTANVQKTATTHRLFSPFPTTCSDVNLNAIGLVTGVRNIRNIPDCRSRRNKGLDWRRWHAPTRKLDAQANLGHAQGNIGPVHLENKARLKQPCSRKSIQVKYNSSWSWSSTTTLKPTLLICCTRAWILQGHTQASEAFTVKIS